MRYIVLIIVALIIASIVIRNKTTFLENLVGLVISRYF